MPTLATCTYCGAPIAWTPRTTGGPDVALDLDPVELETAHPDAPVYAVRRDGYATPARDLHTAPRAVHLAHRCPQYVDALEAVDALSARDDLEAWLLAAPPAPSSTPRRLRVVS